MSGSGATPQVLGHCVSVPVFESAQREASMGSIAESVLSTAEQASWSACRSGRRRAQLLAGRIAAKLTANLCRVASGMPLASLSRLPVAVMPSGHRAVADPLLGFVPVSISHTRQIAVAVAANGNKLPGVDIEPAPSRVRPGSDFFHPEEIEDSRTVDALELRMRWMLKEAAGKLYGVGLATGSHGMRSIRGRSGKLGVAVPAVPGVVPLLAVNDKLAIGFLLLDRAPKCFRAS